MERVICVSYEVPVNEVPVNALPYNWPITHLPNEHHHHTHSNLYILFLLQVMPVEEGVDLYSAQADQDVWLVRSPDQVKDQTYVINIYTYRV